jgi:hypothetical protein
MAYILSHKMMHGIQPVAQFGQRWFSQRMGQPSVSLCPFFFFDSLRLYYSRRITPTFSNIIKRWYRERGNSILECIHVCTLWLLHVQPHKPKVSFL